jgi:hypothetical protein
MRGKKNSFFCQLIEIDLMNKMDTGETGFMVRYLKQVSGRIIPPPDLVEAEPAGYLATPLTIRLHTVNTTFLWRRLIS